MTASIVVSIHDVAPSTLDGVRWLLAALDRIGARPRVLKVIPNADDRLDIRNCPELLRLLSREAAAGSEIVQHGYTHRAGATRFGSWPLQLRAGLFAGDAAEFLSLDRATMAERLRRGRAILTDAGLTPRGFCAPAWLSTPELPPLLRALDFRYLATMAAIVDLRHDRRLRLPWLGYMGAGTAQERLIGVGGRLTLAATALGRDRAGAIKIFLHPQGAARSTACAAILRRLAQLLRERRPMTYGQLLDHPA